MTADEFAGLIRKGDTRFRVTKLILRAEGEVIRGQGSLQIVKDDFEIVFEVAARYDVPSPERELWKPADAWKITGVIEGDLKFSSHRVSPHGKNVLYGFGRKPAQIQRLRLETIELIPVGFDALSKTKKDRLFGKTPSPKLKYPDVEFHAVLFNCQPVFFNAGTKTKVTNDFLGNSGGSALDTFIDRSNDYDFALIKRDQETDVHLRSKSQFHSVSQEGDWRRFHSLLFGIGFTHGFQPWPYRIQFWRGGRKITDRITVPHPLTKTSHAPFDREIGFTGISGIRGARGSAIRLAATFFERKDRLSEYLSHLLFLHRDTGSASFRIKTLAVCSLFEGVVNLIFDELKLEHLLRQQEPQYQEFIKLRNRLVRRLLKIAANSTNRPMNRLAGILGSAKEFNVSDKFKAICQHFGLNFKVDMEKHLNAWSRKRNAIMHGKWKDEDSDFSDQSLIAGAINILALKTMGFSGRMKFNAVAHKVADRYRLI
jgi:hypothetical protein